MYKNIDFKKINGLNLQNKNNSQSDDFYNFFSLRKYGDLFLIRILDGKFVPRYPLPPTVILRKSNKLSFVIIILSDSQLKIEKHNVIFSQL